MKRTYLLSIVLVAFGLMFATTSTAQLNGKKILLDPGHGGSDPGATGINGGTYPDEADLVLDCSLDLRTRLQNAGATVYMTRSTDRSVGLYTRRDLANSYNPSAYISIHLNSASFTAHGTETWYYHNSRLASNIQSKMVANTGLSNRGIKQNGWAVLTCNSWIPACLTEGCFISNSSDWSFINSTSGYESWVDSHEQGLYSYWGLTAPAGKPSIPNLRTILNSNSNKGVTVSWSSNPESNIIGYRVYYTVGNNLSNWKIAANESTLKANSTSVTFNSPADFHTPTNEAVYYFRVTAINDEGIESEPSDIYARSSLSNGTGLKKVLIVDGFDRYGGSASYSKPTHSFNTDYFKAVRDNGSFVISSTANEPIAEGKILMADYDIVIWFVGDESTDKQTFTTWEQAKIKTYLESGGQLMVSGSEIGWDLYNEGNTDDKNFYNNYLKASFQNDGGSGRNPATGKNDFAGVSLNFGQTYIEDYPDEIAPRNGSETILTYANNTTGGIAYKGIIGNGSEHASVIYLAFPFETVADYSAKIGFMGKVLEYFNADQGGTPHDDNIVIIDDFESNTGHFDKALDYSSTTTGINSAASSSARVTNYAKNGMASLKLVLSDDASSTNNWKIRHLSGIGSPANNVEIPSDAKIQLWMATSTANAAARVYLWVDDEDGIEQSTKATIVNNGDFVLYQWDLADNSVWSAFTGNGAIDGAKVTIDAIMLEAPNASSNWILYIDDVAYNTNELDCQSPSLTEIIMDNTDATLTGTWASSTSNPNFYGANYIHDSGSGKGSKEVKFTTNIEYDGYYKVYERHTAGTNRSHDVPVEINGTSTVCVNQQINDGDWVLLGTHLFTAGTGEVIIKNANTENVTIADAIKLEFVSCNANFVTLDVPASVVVETSSSYHGLVSSNVERVIVEVDGYEIADETVVNGEYSFDYSFNSVGTGREIVAKAFNASNNLIATLIQHKTVHSVAQSPNKATSIEQSENFDKSEKLDLIVYPNPTHSQATVELVGIEDFSNISLQLFDASGRLLQTQPMKTNSLVLNLDRYETGLYFINVVGKQFKKNIRVVKR